MSLPLPSPRGYPRDTSFRTLLDSMLQRSVEKPKHHWSFRPQRAPRRASVGKAAALKLLLE